MYVFVTECVRVCSCVGCVLMLCNYSVPLRVVLITLLEPNPLMQLIEAVVEGLIERYCPDCNTPSHH